VDAVTRDDGPLPKAPDGADPRVDWPAVIRRAQRENLVGFPVVLGWLAGIVLLDDGFGVFHGRTAWLVLGGYLLLVTVVVLAVPRARRAQATGRVVRAALRVHADPGPAVRTRVDVLVRRSRANRWAGWWVFPAITVLFLAQGHWSRPTTAVTGALLLLPFAVVGALQVRRTQADARRWAADPPGPPRELPPPAAWERWTSGRRLWIAAVGFGVAVGLAGALVAVLVRLR
jgi:hypothetical protein